MADTIRCDVCKKVQHGVRGWIKSYLHNGCFNFCCVKCFEKHRVAAGLEAWVKWEHFKDVKSQDGGLEEHPEIKNKAFLSAWRKGFDAKVAGKSESDCPYGDDTIMSRNFKNYWLKGWRDRSSSSK